MKRFFFVLVAGLFVLALGIALLAVLQAAGAATANGLDALDHAVTAYPSARVGELTGMLIVARWNIEVAKLLFWIHLFS